MTTPRGIFTPPFEDRLTLAIACLNFAIDPNGFVSLDAVRRTAEQFSDNDAYALEKALMKIGSEG